MRQALRKGVNNGKEGASARPEEDHRQAGGKNTVLPAYEETHVVQHGALPTWVPFLLDCLPSQMGMQPGDFPFGG